MNTPIKSDTTTKKTMIRLIAGVGERWAAGRNAAIAVILPEPEL